ncbi:MAG: hypothetical protein AAGA99_02530 [Actinomycetota bacterium]
MGATMISAVDTRIADRVVVGELVYEHGPEGGSLRRAEASTALFGPRSDPPELLPARSEIFGREDLLATVREAWSLGDSVVVQGRPGGGTSSVLRLLAHGHNSAEFPDGVLFVDGAGWRVDDLLQRVAEAFHRCDRPGIGLVLRPEEIAQILSERRALVIIDHADLAPAHLAHLADSLPAGVVVLGTSVALEGPISTTLGLPGLDTAGGIELLAREFARPLNAVQRADAERLIAALSGRPLSLVQAAGRIRMEHAGLHDTPPTAEDVVRDLIDPDGGRSTTQVVAATFAAYWPTRLNRDGLAAMLGAPHDLDDAVASLLDLGVVTGSEPTGYTVDPALIDRIAARFDLPSVRKVAAERLASWAASSGRSDAALADLGPAAAQAALWASDAGDTQRVMALAKAYDRPLATTRRWQLWGELLAHARHACSVGDVDPLDEAWVLHQAGTRLVALGDPRAGRALLQHALDLRRSLGHGDGAAVTAANLGLDEQQRSRPPVFIAAAVVLLLAAVLAVVMIVTGNTTSGSSDVAGSTTAVTSETQPAGTPASDTAPPTTVATTSAPTSAAPTTTPPAVPAPPSPAEVSVVAAESSVRITWDGSEDATEYEVLRDGSTVARVDAGDDGWTDEDVERGATHEYSVLAIGADGARSLPSPGISATIEDGDQRGPTTPGAVAATVDGTTITVTWTASQDRSGIEAYVIRRDGVEIARVGEDALSFTDTEPTPGATHAYDVTAVDTAGNTSAIAGPATVTATAPDTTPPSAPGGLGVGQELAPEPPAVVVTWGAATDDTGVVAYRVLRAGSVVVELGGDTTILADPDWRLGRFGGDDEGCGETFVTYAVEAVDAAGNVSPATSATFTIPPSC